LVLFMILTPMFQLNGSTIRIRQPLAAYADAVCA
jgi:hypothetical protein